MDKYYTPEIEEFHVGFEYEIHNDPRTEDGWDKAVVQSRDWNSMYCIKEDCDTDYRVKHLNREDIEGEGFAEDKLFLDISVKHGMEVYHKEVEHRGELKNLMLVYNPMSRWVVLSIGTSPQFSLESKYETPVIQSIDMTLVGSIFAGHIKNLSEFRRILKQIGV